MTGNFCNGMHARIILLDNSTASMSQHRRSQLSTENSLYSRAPLDRVYTFSPVHEITILARDTESPVVTLPTPRAIFITFDIGSKNSRPSEVMPEKKPTENYSERKKKEII